MLHERSPSQLLADLQPLWAAQGWDQGGAQDGDQGGEASLDARQTWLQELCALLGPSLTTLQDGIEQARPFFEKPALNETFSRSSRNQIRTRILL